MRTDEERIRAMHRRAAEISIENRHKKVRVIQIASAVCCCAAVILMAVLVPGVSGVTESGSEAAELNASLFANSPAIGYIVIGIIAFILGITVTALCYQLKKWQDEKDKEDLQW